MFTTLSRASILIAVLSLTGAAGGAGANADRVTFIENVRCEAGACEALRKTIPLFETVVE